MSLASNVVKRPGSAVYYARIEVPVDVQPVLKKTQLWKSLRTRDPREAREKVIPVLAGWHAEFAAARQRKHPSPEDVQGAIWTHYTTGLEQDGHRRQALPDAATIDAANAKLTADIEAGRVEWSADPLVQLNAAVDLIALTNATQSDRDSRAVYLKALRRNLADGETALIAWAADDFITREKLIIERGSPAYRDLCQKLLQAEIEKIERTLERDNGDWTGIPANPIVTPADLTRSKKIAAPGETIMELYDRFANERRATATADTWNGNRKTVKLFAEFVGETSHISVINRKSVRDWKHKLSEWPLKAADMKVFRGMSFPKIVEKNAALKLPIISDKTKNKYLSSVGPFAEWLLQNEYIDADVMRGMHLSIDKKNDGFPFSSEQLRLIFSSPIFSTCLGEDKEHLPGNVMIRDWRYWMQWLALYSGARLGEMAQLLTKDIFQSHGVWVMHITEIGDDLKSTKNAGSMRVVPIHSKLVELGFLDYHATAVAGATGKLFPELERDARGYFGAASKFFNGYLRKIGVKVDKNTKFHSFRHSIADAFRNAGYMDDDFDIILGHTKATTTQKYGKISEGNLALRVSMIESVSYASVHDGAPTL